MTQTPLKQYNHLIQSGDLKPDAEQKRAVQSLMRLYDELIEDESSPKPSLFARLTGAQKSLESIPLGIYMYGGVGRGKSMLMDLFYECLPENIKKRRVHFHEFMIEVHDYIHSRSAQGSEKGIVDQALPSLAELIARRSRVLCFDEFHVVDITDAMILGRLFKMLFEHDVIVVATSNWAPDDLYKDGLQRDRFLPFIALLKTKVEVVHLDSPHDYRALTNQIDGTYFTPLNKATMAIMDQAFAARVEGHKVKAESFKVKGRKMQVSAAANGVARFTFTQLCEKPLGAEDYLAIARRYHTVFLENIPKLSADRRNEAKRFMNLIDALYEARVKVIISAEVPPDQIYAGHDHSYEFERTISRLLEMQSAEYL